MFDLTPKQRKFIMTRIRRINILQGSVRSGKTFVSLVAWGLRVALSPPDCTFLMVGKTQTTLKRNCLTVLYQMFGDDFTYSMSSKTGRIFGRLVYLEGADNAKAEDKIRGITLDGAYVDEATLVPESFFTMLLSRLSRPGAFLYATTNPDNPLHWLKTNYIDRAAELDVAVWNFLLEDNTFLPRDYIDNIKKEYTGVFYRRFILGEWVLADGLVFSAFNSEKHLIDPVSRDSINKDYAEKYIGIDYGIENPTCYSLWGWHVKRREWHCLKEYYYSGRETQNPKTDVELYADLLFFSDGIENLRGLIIDPSASSFIVYIQKNRRFKVIKANNDVLGGISFVNSLFAQDKIFLSRECVNAQKELFSYSWDTDRSRQTGRDVVIKISDHFCDSMRYFFFTVVKPKTSLYGITSKVVF